MSDKPLRGPSFYIYIKTRYKISLLDLIYQYKILPLDLIKLHIIVALDLLEWKYVWFTHKTWVTENIWGDGLRPQLSGVLSEGSTVTIQYYYYYF